jgi:phage terminase large subunit-like protein
MGLRGPKAQRVGLRGPTLFDDWQPSHKAPAIPSPWSKPGLTRAQRVVKFLQCLRITSGALSGQRLKLQPWQLEVIECIYGNDRRGRRKIKTALLSLPRKCGKSTFAAGLALAHLAGPEAVNRGQVLSAGADRSQAALIYREIKAFAEATPEIGSRLIFRDFAKSIEHIDTQSIYEALSADHRTAHGKSPSFYVADELAQWRGRELLDALDTGGGAHKESLGLIISTRSPDPDSPLEQLIAYGETGADPKFFSRVWSAPIDADPFDEATWYAAIPGLGKVRSLDDLRAQASKAKGLPSAEAAFRAYALNSPVAVEDRFIGPVDWDGCAEEAPAEGKCFAALDLASGSSDLSAFALYWPHTGRLTVRAFLPRERIDEKAREDRAPYREWEAAGLVVAIPGRAIDRVWLLEWITREVEALDASAIAADRWGLADLKAVCEREGLPLQFEPFGQGFKEMSPATSAFESAVVSRKLRHGGNGLLRWAVSNAVVDTDPAGARKLVKNRSRGRIDPAIAAIMAIGFAARTAERAYDFSGEMFVAV